MKTKLIGLVSWAVVFVSVALENGLGIDFPLAPVLWLAIAVCVMLFTIGNGRTHRSAEWQAATYQASSVLSLSMPASEVGGVSKSADNHELHAVLAYRVMRLRRRVKNLCQWDFSLPDNQQTGVVNETETVTIRDDDQQIIFLSPAAARGPPRVEDQSSRLPGCEPSRSPLPLPVVSSSCQFQLSSRSVFKVQTKREPT
jgi:hypothetical protein